MVFSKARDRLSAVAVRNLKEPGYYHDGAGLYLQVNVSGSKSWIFRYTVNKKTREMGLGSCNAFSLAEARERAHKCRQLLADDVDPMVQRQAAREVAIAVAAQHAKSSRTFEQCAKEYHQENASDWKNAKHRDQWINTLTTYVFPHFGRLPIGVVSLDHMRSALLPIWKTKPETASRVLQRIRTVINYAAAMGYANGLDSERWDQLKHTLPKNSRLREVEHHASCPYDQVGALLKRIRGGTSSPLVKLAFEFIVLTAARSGEVRGAIWSEVDLERRLWTIPKERMKAGKEHTIPLSQAAFEVLQQARGANIAKKSDSRPYEFIFPNTKGQVFSDMTFTQLLRRQEVPYTMHGFRASFRTWGAEIAHYEYELLEHALAHVVGDATARAYQRSDMLEKRRELMEQWADFTAQNSSAQTI